MNLRKVILTASSMALLLMPTTLTMAQDVDLVWQPRTVAEIKADLTTNEAKEVVYTIQYGDTLSAIAEALGVDVLVLGEINKVTNLDLIFPDTVLTTAYDKDHKAEALTIEVPTNEKEKPLVAEVDLKAHEIEIDSQTLALPEASQAAEKTQTATSGYIIEEVKTWVTPITTATEQVIEDTTSKVSETSTSGLEVEASDTTTTSSVTLEETTQASATISEGPTMRSALVVTPETTEASVETTSQVLETTTVETTTQAPATTTVETTTQAPATTTVETTTQAPATTTVAVDNTGGFAANGLRNDVEAFRQEVANLYGITSFSTYRPGDPGDHGKGLAVDFMVPVGSDLGDQVAQYALSSMGNYKISYVIWEQQIYGTWNPSWVMMEDRGSVTQNHYDHVHVSFY